MTDGRPLAEVLRRDDACDAFEAAWKAGPRPRVEDFAAPGDAELLHELVEVDAAYRRRAGERPAAGDYLARFPGLDAARLARALGPADAPLRCPHCHQPVPAPAGDAAAVDCPHCGSSFRVAAPAALGAAPARVGRFALCERLGQGACGTVWRAIDTELGREVALKMPHAGLLDSAEARERFRREARAAARLRHPGIVAVHEAPVLDGLPVLVEDFVAGSSLREVLARRRLAPPEAANLAAEAAEALDYAHRQGAVHRDVKPANLMVTPEGRAVVVDFGLASPGGAAVTLTLDGQVVGTPAYMAPEQARGDAHAIDRRADVYGLGVVLYEMLCGEPPFRGSKAMLLEQVLREEPRPPRRVNHRVPRDLETVCLKAMAKEPAGRYPTAGELAADLRRFLAGEPVKARPVSLAGRGVRWARRRPAAAGLAAASVVAALAGVGLAVSLWHSARVGAAYAAAEAARRGEAEQRAAAESGLYLQRVGLAQREWAANNVGQARRLLGECPPARRGWEWHYLDRLCRRDLLTLVHPQPPGGTWSVQAVAYFPDGRRLASASRDGKLRVWDAAKGRMLLEIDAGRMGGFCVAVSPDGEWLAAGQPDGRVQTWDAATGSPGRAYAGAAKGVCSVAYSPDGTRLAAGGGTPDAPHLDRERDTCRVTVWDAATGREVRSFAGLTRPAVGLAFSPDGTSLAVASGDLLPSEVERRPGELRVWDIGTGSLKWEGRGLEGSLTAVAFSPDGRTLASAGWDQAVRLQDAATGAGVRALRGHRDWVLGLAYRPDGSALASASADGSVRLWNPAAGVALRALRGHSAAVNGVAFSPDGTRLASAGSDEVVKVWDPDDDQEAETVRLPGPVSAAAFLPDGRLVVGCNPTGPDGRATGELRVWSGGPDAEPLPPVPPPPESDPLAVRAATATVTGVAVSRDGTRVAAGVRRRAAFWGTRGLGFGPANAVPLVTARAVAFGPDRDRLFALGAPLACLDLGRGGPAWTGRPAVGAALAVSPDGRLVAVGSGNRTVDLHDAETGAVLRSFPAHDRVASALAFSPDGRRLATGSWDQTVKLWDVAAVLAGGPAEPAGVCRGHLRPVLAVAFSPDGRRLVTGGQDHGVRLWDAETAQEILPLAGHAGFVTAVAFSPDGRRVVSGSYDGTVKVWRAGDVGGR